MRLEGSCQCERVKFRVESDTPYPFMSCYCSICRKLAGGAYGTNILAKRSTLKVSGKKHIDKYHARIREPGKKTKKSGATRAFCSKCGTHLWLMDKRHPEGMWPNAAVIDTPLPSPPPNARVHIMTSFKPDWVPLAGPGKTFPGYPKQSIQAWHEEQGLVAKAKSARTKSKSKSKAKSTSTPKTRAAKRRGATKSVAAASGSSKNGASATRA